MIGDSNIRRFDKVVPIFFFLIVSFLWSENVTIQNGVNGYEGCIDSYLSDKGDEENNYGFSPTLKLQNDH